MWKDELRQKIEQLKAEDYKVRNSYFQYAEVEVALDLPIEKLYELLCHQWSINSRPVAGVAAQCLMLLGLRKEEQRVTAKFAVYPGTSPQPMLLDRNEITQLKLYSEIDFNEF